MSVCKDSNPQFLIMCVFLGVVGDLILGLWSFAELIFLTKATKGIGEIYCNQHPEDVM